MKEEGVPQEVENNLYSNEYIQYIIRKKYSLEIRPKFLIVTDKRVIFFDKKIFGRYHFEDIPYEKLEYIRFKTGLIASEFLIHREGGSFIKLGWLDKNEVIEAIETIRDYLNDVAKERVSIVRNKGLFGEKWEISKPEELITR